MLVSDQLSLQVVAGSLAECFEVILDSDLSFARRLEIGVLLELHGLSPVFGPLDS